MKSAANLDLSQNQLQNAVVQPLVSAPGAPALGQIYFNSSSKIAFVWNGAAWRPSDAAGLTDGSIAIAALAVNPLARANHTGTQAASTISDLAAVVKAYTLDSFAVPAAAMNFGSQELTNIAQATTTGSAARWDQVQAYVGDRIDGIVAIKDPARVIASANITLSGTQTIDGVAVVAGDRVLVAGQTDATQNGIYVVAAGAWSRAADASTGTDLAEGTQLLVSEGTSASGTIWRVTTSGAITLGTTALAFTQVAKTSTYTADGNTLTLTGSVFSAHLDPSGWLTSSSAGIAVDKTKLPGKTATTLTGDGSTTAWNVTHTLGTTDVIVQVHDSSGNLVLVDIQATNTTTVNVSFAQAPTSGVTYRVVIFG